MSPAPALNGEEVERVARAIWAATDGEGSGLPWDDKRLSEFYRDRYRGYARAALAARRPATEAEGAVERVKRLIAFYDRHEYASLNVDDLRAALTPAADGGDPA